MIEFKTRTQKRKIEVSDRIGEKFKNPLIFFLRNGNDKRQIFYTIVLADLPNKELTYIQSYFGDNVARLEESDEEQLLTLLNYVNPHCSLQIRPGQFYVFVEGTNFFLRIDASNNTMQLCFCKDLNVPGCVLDTMGSTCFRDDSDPNYFYFSAVGKDAKGEAKGNERTLYYLRSNLDLSDIQVIYQKPRSQYARPAHVTRKFKEYLFCSEFLKVRRKLNQTGQIFETTPEIIHFIYEDLFHEFCATTDQAYSGALFEEHATFNFEKNEIKLSPTFKSFCNTFGTSWVDICQKTKKYSFKQLPGSFTVLNLLNNRMDRYETSSCPAAHIEIDTKNEIIYVSSHNFIRSPQGIYYLGPAAIDKFKIQDEKLLRVGTFSDSTGYRFASHRVFRYKDRPYICVIGHPNRIFFIDAETMKTYYYYDIYEDVLSGKTDIADFLNTSPVGKKMAVAFDVSDDGECIFILGQTHMYLFSFPERKFVEEIPFMTEEPFENEISLTGFHVATVHLTQLI